MERVVVFFVDPAGVGHQETVEGYRLDLSPGRGRQVTVRVFDADGGHVGTDAWYGVSWFRWRPGGGGTRHPG